MALTFSYFPLFLSLLLTSSAACNKCLQQSKASYFSPSSLSAAGACGYGSLVSSFNKGFIAAAGSAIYKEGIACGACFRITCKHPRLCSSKGVKVVVTDRNKASSNTSDFMLNTPAFIAMARAGLEQDLKDAGLVDAEYERIPCAYENKNLSIRVEESSSKPNNLTIKFLYQGGQTDILAVDVARFGSSNWQFMSRANGPIWNTDRAPPGPLQFRVVVTSGYDGKWVWAQKEVLPLDWKVGAIYDTGVQITDVARDGCNPCDDVDD